MLKTITIWHLSKLYLECSYNPHRTIQVSTNSYFFASKISQYYYYAQKAQKSYGNRQWTLISEICVKAFISAAGEIGKPISIVPPTEARHQSTYLAVLTNRNV